MQHIKIKVTGKVQGVYFRASTKKKAESLGLCGWCRNEADGSVCIEAEGSAEALAELVHWCHEGPELANVEKVEVIEDEIISYKEFSIKRF